VDTPRPSPRTNRTRRVPHPAHDSGPGAAGSEAAGARGEGGGAGAGEHGAASGDGDSDRSVAVSSFGDDEGAGYTGDAGATSLRQGSYEGAAAWAAVRRSLGECYLERRAGPPFAFAPPPPPPHPRTKWTRRVPHPVLIGHAASLSQVSLHLR
jgi:hypothetical protein